jgi:hypothetical protein
MMGSAGSRSAASYEANRALFLLLQTAGLGNAKRAEQRGQPVPGAPSPLGKVSLKSAGRGWFPVNVCSFGPERTPLQWTAEV